MTEDPSSPSRSRAYRSAAAFALSAAFAACPLLHGCAFDPMHLRAAHDLECASEKLDVTEIDDDRVRYAGCGKTAVYFCVVNNHGYRECKREMPNPRVMVQEVAGKDFSCPREKIVVDDVKEGFAAKGCNRSDVYSCAPVLTSFRCARVGGPPVGSGSAPGSASAPPATSASAR